MAIVDWSRPDSLGHEPWAGSPEVLRFLRVVNGDLTWDEPGRRRTRRSETDGRRDFYVDYLEVE
jgi:hypothetical protein